MTDEHSSIDATIEGRTVPVAFADSVRLDPGAVALRWREGDDAWGELTYGQYADQACRVAAAITAAGVKPGDRILLMMRNRPEFHIADMAALLVGATPISVYNSNAPEQIAYVANDSQAKWALVEDIGYLERFLKVRDQLSALRGIAIIDDPDGLAPAHVGHWSQLVAFDPVDFDTAIQVAEPDQLATVIYTSGTTGPPKGVMLDHRNVLWTVESLRRAFGEDLRGKRVVSYLPMAHIAERSISHYGGSILGYEVTTCPEATMVASYLPHVRPELFFAVPRIWEKAYATIASLARADADAAKHFDKAIEIGWEVSEFRACDEAVPAELAARFEAVDAQTLGVWRGLIGLDHCEFAITGAAPIPFEIFRFFRGLGVPISEVYGLSETTGPLTWSPKVRAGTVGPAIPGCEVVLAEDGEVLGRGGNIFRGYLNQPEKTAEVLEPDGWFHTGDIGQFDDANYLRIVDRKKELIITAGGKNISPANLEAALKSYPLVGQVCVIGDARPFISALIVLDPEIAPVWAASHGITATDLPSLALNPDVIAEVQRNVDDANQHFSSVEQVKRFHVLSDEWLPDSEELTPTMKLKRRGIHQKYAAEIEQLYTR
ncbi:MAG: AMP-dependent synthetase/ligase [Acidimicrobiia bacterium]